MNGHLISWLLTEVKGKAGRVNTAAKRLAIGRIDTKADTVRNR